MILSRACEQFTGAQIEAVFIDALHEAYAESREPGPKDIIEAMTRTVATGQPDGRPDCRLAPLGARPCT